MMYAYAVSTKRLVVVPVVALAVVMSGPRAQAQSAADPGSDGQWQPPMLWDVIAIHAAVMPTGEVLHYSYPDGTDGSRARLWDPVT